jgi:hypothetical protein
MIGHRGPYPEIEEHAMSTTNIRSSGSEQLSRLMDLAASDATVWQPDELAAILQHQLSAPVQFDLGNLDAKLAEQVQAISSSQGLLLKSFGDLLQHPHPPLALLELCKEFARAYWHHPQSPLPREVAMLLYFASIAAALTRCRRRITRLDQATLRKNFQWFLDQSWVDEPSRRLFREALPVLGLESGVSP